MMVAARPLRRAAFFLPETVGKSWQDFRPFGRSWQDMAGHGRADLKQRLTTALLRFGQDRLSKIWGVDESEVGRRLNGQRNIPLDHFVAALDELGIELVTPDQGAVTVPRDELAALRYLARKSLVRDGDE
jgi:hypothetical protein